ncbi:hypothetical protein ARMGADRAFT_1083643 [Armillaria gallica]|uniref:Uncharacterized protein n=1 Tax=Armillaria gallica TaxID=47427 RepID=A0A2H3DQE4_ARMGA|nr:hypothetical protein ARMGADRAFT_1083643 [Armillaria gallica]
MNKNTLGFQQEAILNQCCSAVLSPSLPSSNIGSSSTDLATSTFYLVRLLARGDHPRHWEPTSMWRIWFGRNYAGLGLCWRRARDADECGSVIIACTANGMYHPWIIVHPRDTVPSICSWQGKIWTYLTGIASQPFLRIPLAALLPTAIAVSAFSLRFSVTPSMDNGGNSRPSPFQTKLLEGVATLPTPVGRAAAADLFDKIHVRLLDYRDIPLERENVFGAFVSVEICQI